MKTYIRFNCIFECNFNQRVENIHSNVKTMTSKQTFANIAAIRINEHIKKKIMMYELKLNNQRVYFFRLLQHDRRSFKCIDFYFIHYVLQRIFEQWIKIKNWIIKIEDDENIAFVKNECENECENSLRVKNKIQDMNNDCMNCV